MAEGEKRLRMGLLNKGQLSTNVSLNTPQKLLHHLEGTVKGLFRFQQGNESSHETLFSVLSSCPKWHNGPCVYFQQWDFPC